MPAWTMDGVGRMALVTDPLGAPFYIMASQAPQPSRAFVEHGTGPAMGHVVWNERIASDPDRALAFFGRHFGWSHQGGMPMGELGEYRFLADGPVVLGALMGVPPGASRAGISILRWTISTQRRRGWSMRVARSNSGRWRSPAGNIPCPRAIRRARFGLVGRGRKIPPRHGEGDHAKHGGGVSPLMGTPLRQSCGLPPPLAGRNRGYAKRRCLAELLIGCDDLLQPPFMAPVAAIAVGVITPHQLAVPPPERTAIGIRFQPQHLQAFAVLPR